MKKTFLTILLFSLLLSSCDVFQGDGNTDPNVNEDDFLNSSNAMNAWVAGTELQMAQAVGQYTQLLELVSDNYYNNYSRPTNAFDVPQLLSTDNYVRALQQWVGTLRESADYGFNTVAAHGHIMTQDQRFRLTAIKGYSFILGGENFTGLPGSNGGEVLPWRDLLDRGAEVLDSALAIAPTDSDKAYTQTLLARAYYRLGNRSQAVEHARQALALSNDFVRFVRFDGDNNISNAAQEAIWSWWFQPLPRLDFLDPKYFQTTSSSEQRPIVVAKAEEDYLILAEAAASEGDDSQSREYLKQLLALVKSRPVAHNVNDANDNRYNGGTKSYPNSADYVVRASTSDPYRSGLVNDHSTTTTDNSGKAVASYLVDIPYISGTSVTEQMIDAASGDSLLEIIYLMRQEIFFAEGRRMADLGIRLPLCDVEAANMPSTARSAADPGGRLSSADDYTVALIPDFIPMNGEMDAFDMDTENKTVTIHNNMNHLIVVNKGSEYVVPFE